MPFLERLKDATIGSSGYARLARDRAGGFGYMALLLLIVILIRTGIDTVYYKNQFAFFATQVAAAPDFSLQDGEFHFSGPMPYRTDKDGAVFIIDTTGKTGPEALKGANQGVLITKDRVYQVSGMGRMQETDLGQFPISLDKGNVVRFVEGLWWIVPVAYAFAYLFQLGFKALDACILGAIALMFASSRGRKIPFELGFKLGLYAMSLSVILQWVFPNFTTIPFLGSAGATGFLVWWGLAVGYLIAGLSAYFRSVDEEAAGPFGPTE